MSLVDLPRINLLIQVIVGVKKKWKKKTAKHYQQHVFSINFSLKKKKTENQGKKTRTL